MDCDALLALGSRAVEAALRGGARQAEAALSYATGARVDFEKNDLQLATSDEGTTLGIRVLLDDRVGFAATNDPDTIEDTVADALAIAATSVADENADLPEPREAPRIEGLHDPAVESLDVAAVTAAGADLLERLRGLDPRLSVDSGSVAAGLGRRAVVNSKGIALADETSSVGGHLFGMAVDEGEVGSFAVSARGSRRREDLEPLLEKVADRFAEKALGALHPQPGRSYRGQVLFSPEAVSSLLVGDLVAMLGSPNVRKGKSPLGTKLGERVASPLLTLIDDGTRPGSLGSSRFDREGLPRAPLALIEDGVARNLLFNHYEARCAGRAEGSTGHAAGSSAALPGVGPTRLDLLPGRTALSTLLAEARDLVLVTRFSGSTNPVTGDFSGVVKSGFLLRDGGRRPVAETLISGNLLDLLREVAAVSAETEELYGGSRMPWVLADGVSVTAG